MPLESQPRRQIAAPLAHRVGDEAGAAQIAGAAFSIWEEIDDALTPILGPQGVVALYKRAVHLTSAAYPWLSGRGEAVETAMDPAALKSVLAQRSSADAAAGGSAFFQTFHDLLATLVGPSLTERLLRSVWENSSSGLPAQDTSS